MEGLVVHTNSGRSAKLSSYYSHWERKVFESLNKVYNKIISTRVLPCLGRKSAMPLHHIAKWYLYNIIVWKLFEAALK